MIPVAGIMAALVPSLPEASLVALRDYGTKSFREAVAAGARVCRRFRHRRRARGIDPGQPRIFHALANLAEALHAGRPRRRCPARSSISPIWRARFEPWWTLRSKRWQAGASRKAGIDAVRDYFYRGEIAKKIDEFSRANGGLLRYDDMAAFHADARRAVATEFHGARVYKPGFWSQGPAMIETLNILNGVDLSRHASELPLYIHTLVEALKLAYADRDTYYGDPKFSHIPGRRVALDGLCRRPPEADRRKGFARIPAGPDRRSSSSASFRSRDRAYKDRRLPDGTRHDLRRRHG